MMTTAAILTLCAQGKDAWAAEKALQATNTPNPCPANKPRGRHLVKYPYVWYYRTEVHNFLKVPLRIVSFICYRWTNNHWVNASNILHHPLRTKEFVAWYDNGDIPRNGWIAPGKTAVCDPDWNSNGTGKGQKIKWVFYAEDAQGKRYQAEALAVLKDATSR